MLGKIRLGKVCIIRAIVSNPPKRAWGLEEISDTVNEDTFSMIRMTARVDWLSNNENLTT